MCVCVSVFCVSLALSLYVCVCVCACVCVCVYISVHLYVHSLTHSSILSHINVGHSDRSQGRDSRCVCVCVCVCVWVDHGYFQKWPDRSTEHCYKSKALEIGTYYICKMLLTLRYCTIKHFLPGCVLIMYQ